MNRLDAFHAALDKDPSDQTIRGVMADYLEENGQEEEAECLRWMAKNDVYPNLGWSTRPDRVRSTPDEKNSWDFSHVEVEPWMRDFPHCCLPKVLYDLLPYDHGNDFFKENATRREAEEALFTAWKLRKEQLLHQTTR